MYSIATGIATNGSVLAVSTGYFGSGSGAVLTSSTGTDWVEQQPGGTARMFDVHGDGDGFVAVGFRESESADYTPVIWISRDGVDWTDLSPPGARGILRSIARTTSGTYLAAGTDGDGSLVVWRSADGVDWQSVALGAISSNRNWPVVRMTASGGPAVLIADTTDGFDAWVSDEGSRWDEAGGFLGSSAYGSWLSLELWGETIVAFNGSQLWVGLLSRGNEGPE